MKIFLVCSTSSSWMATGYGRSLLAGDGSLLVSFLEFAKNIEQQFIPDMSEPYVPIVNRDKRAIDELGKGLLPIITNHPEVKESTE